MYISMFGGAVARWLTPQTPDPEVGGSSPTEIVVLCPWARHIYPQYTGNTQEAVAPSQYDRIIVYRDVKHQTKHLCLYKPEKLLKTS